MKKEKKAKEPNMWEIKKTPLKGAFFYEHFHSITPHENNQGGKK